jgi:hypothetical protein
MGFAGYVAICVQLYFVGFHYLSSNLQNPLNNTVQQDAKI